MFFKTLVQRFLGMKIESVPSAVVRDFKVGDTGMVCGWSATMDTHLYFPFRVDEISGDRARDPANLRWRAVANGSGVRIEIFVPDGQTSSVNVFSCNPGFFRTHFIFTFLDVW